MLRKELWLHYTDDLQVELQQSRDEGKNVEGYSEKIKEVQLMESENPDREKKAAEIMDELATIKAQEGYPFIEPSDIVSIRKERTGENPDACFDVSAISDEKLYDKIYGAWLGRCAGCLLGQPIEGWHRERINGLLRETGNYPIKYYISSSIPAKVREKYGVVDEAHVYGGSKRNWINNVNYMPEDDDTNYTIIGLKILEGYGSNFTPDDVGESWLANLPVFHVCTAERVAYRNMVNLVYPPESASFRNPYREWIGAQIRADMFGYVSPGNPRQGAEFAWRDASISHVKNGIYGEMFVAAMLSAAAVKKDVKEIIEIALSQIPQKSRLVAAVREALNWMYEGISWEEAIDRVHSKYDEKNSYDWCHTIPNAMIVCIGLLFGELDFEKSIGIAVSGAFDTDCNGATVGSIVGMILGAKALPERWIVPLNDRIKSGVDGFGLVKISDMAKRTLDIIKTIKVQPE